MRNVITALLLGLLSGCGSSDVKPVDIFSEDMCSNCRMSVSDRSFVSELMDDQGGVFKFDDLNCLESFRKKSPTLNIKALFVTDYDTKSWIPYELSTIVQTGIRTPMASGKVAFKDPVKAKEFLDQHPLLSSAVPSCCQQRGE